MKISALLIVLSVSFCAFGQTGSLDVVKKKLDSNDFKGAKEDLTKILNTNPRNREALILRAKAKNALEDYYGAIGDLNFALEIDSSTFEP